MAKYGSGSKKVTPNVGLRTGRYQYLALEDAEPNLGFTSEKVLPLKDNYYQLVSFDGGTVYDRYWQVAPAGIITGITIFDEGFIVGTGNSINKLDFRGNIITATANNFGTISTITVAPPGSDTQLIYNSGGNFAASANLTFSSNILSVTGLGSFSQGSYNQYVRVGVASNNVIDTTIGNLVLDANSGITSIKSALLAGISTFSGSNSSNLVTLSQTGTGNALFANGTVISGLGSIGVGTTVPTQELDVNGDIRLRGTIYDYNNQPGNTSDILVKNSVGGLEWVNQSTVQTGAGGTYTNVQYQTYAGLMGGAPNFVYESTNSRVGIGSTQPQYLLDVLGYSRFTGQTEISNLIVTGVSTLGFVTATNGYFTGVVTAITFNGNATSASYASIAGVSTSVIGGIASVSQLNVSGVSTLTSLGVIGLTTTQNFRATGVSTLGITSIQQLNVSGISTLSGAKIKNINVGTTDDNTISTPTGNLTLDSSAGTTIIKDIVSVDDISATTSTTDGALVVKGGVGIAGSLNIGGHIAVGSTFGVTGTSFLTRLIISGVTTFTNTTESTNKDTGSVIVEGGVGIERNLNVGGASSISGITTFGSNVLPFNNSTQNIGSESQRWNNVWATTFNGKFLGNADTAGYATTAGMSTNLVGGSSGVVPYQSGTNATSFTQVGTAKSLLQSNGAAAPTWIDPGTLNVAYASSAGIATNLRGGIVGQIPYQTDTNKTAFIQVGVAGSLLQSNGAGAPTWVQPSQLSVQFAAYASSAGIATNLRSVSGDNGQVPWQFNAGITSFTTGGSTGQLLQWGGITGPTWISPLGLFVQNAGYANTSGIATYAVSAGIATYATRAGLSTNLVSIAATGQVPYQSADNTTLFTTGGIGGQLLQYNGLSGPIWTSPQGLTIGYANTAGIATYATRAGIATYSDTSGIATNLRSVSANTGQVPWQFNVGITSFTTGGISGSSLLQYNGTSAPTWVSPTNLTVQNALYADNAGIATNIKGGTSGQVPWQFNVGITSFTTGGTSGSSLLQYNGSTGPTWVSPSNLTVQNALYANAAGIATHLRSVSANTGQVPWQRSIGVTSFTTGGISGSSLLQYNGSTGPIWVELSDLTASNALYAVSAGIATNLRSVSANTGQIPWQRSIGVTSFTTGGVSGSSLLQYNGTNAPTWVEPTNLTIQNALYAVNAGIATNLKSVSGNRGQIPWQSIANETLFTTGGTAGASLLQFGGNAGPTWVNLSDLTATNALYAVNAGIATNLKSSSTNNFRIPYQSAVNTTSFLPVGVAGSILSSKGSGEVPEWINPNTTASQSVVVSDSSNSSRYITFAADTGSQNLGIDKSNLIYNPSSNILTVPIVKLTSFVNSANTVIANTTANGLQSNSFGVGTAPSTTAGEIRATNNITAYYSDERLKENIKPIPSALSKLLALRGVTFNSNKTAEQYGYTDKKEQIGVIAQEVEKVLPQIVVPAPFDIAQDEDGNEYSKSGENYKTVQYDKLVPLLIEAIKEQQETIINLQRRIESLEK